MRGFACIILVSATLTGAPAMADERLEKTHARLCKGPAKPEACALIDTALTERASAATAEAPQQAAPEQDRAGLPPVVWGPLAQLANTYWTHADPTIALQHGSLTGQAFVWDGVSDEVLFTDFSSTGRSEIRFRPGSETGTLIAEVIESVGASNETRRENVAFRFDGNILASEPYKAYGSWWRRGFQVSDLGGFFSEINAEGRKKEFVFIGQLLDGDLGPQYFALNRSYPEYEFSALLQQSKSKFHADWRESVRRYRAERRESRERLLSGVIDVMGAMAEGYAQERARQVESNANLRNSLDRSLAHGPAVYSQAQAAQAHRAPADTQQQVSAAASATKANAAMSTSGSAQAARIQTRVRAAPADAGGLSAVGSGARASTDEDARRCVTPAQQVPNRANPKGVAARITNQCETVVRATICLHVRNRWNCGATFGIAPGQSWTYASAFPLSGGIWWDAVNKDSPQKLGDPPN